MSGQNMVEKAVVLEYLWKSSLQIIFCIKLFYEMYVRKKGNELSSKYIPKVLQILVTTDTS